VLEASDIGAADTLDAILAADAAARAATERRLTPC
jgi:hypothetical protein